jgi:hypothetical protein
VSSSRWLYNSINLLHTTTNPAKQPIAAKLVVEIWKFSLKVLQNTKFLGCRLEKLHNNMVTLKFCFRHELIQSTMFPTCRHQAPHCTDINTYTASCENAMNLSMPGVLASCEKFPHSSQLNFWSTKSIFNQFSVFVKTLNALCVCLQYKHLRSMKKVIRSDKPVTFLLLLWLHKCDFGAEPRSRKIATSAVKGLNICIYM